MVTKIQQRKHKYRYNNSKQYVIASSVFSTIYDTLGATMAEFIQKTSKGNTR